MENDKEKYQLVEDAINQCIENLKKVEPILDEISYNGESLFKKSRLKRKMEYVLIDFNEFIDEIHNRDHKKIPKF